MCNLYSITKGPQAIRDFARAMRGDVGDMPPLPGVFPDYFAPIVRNVEDGQREHVKARWSIPSPKLATRAGRRIPASRTSATHPRHTGDDGSGLRVAAPSRSRASPRTNSGRTARARPLGPHSRTAGRSLSLRGSG